MVLILRHPSTSYYISIYISSEGSKHLLNSVRSRHKVIVVGLSNPAISRTDAPEDISIAVTEAIIKRCLLVVSEAIVQSHSVFTLVFQKLSQPIFWILD